MAMVQNCKVMPIMQTESVIEY